MGMQRERTSGWMDEWKKEAPPSHLSSPHSFLSLMMRTRKALSSLPLFFVCAVPIYCGGVKKGPQRYALVLYLRSDFWRDFGRDSNSTLIRKSGNLNTYMMMDGHLSARANPVRSSGRSMDTPFLLSDA